VYWLNPLAYAFRALAINEFSQARWQQAGGADGTLGSSILGFFQVQQRSSGSASSWVWDGIGVLVGMWAVAGAVSLLAYTYNKLPESFAVFKEAEPLAAGTVSKCQAGGGGGKGQSKGAAEVVIELPLTPGKCGRAGWGGSQWVNVSWLCCCPPPPPPASALTRRQPLFQLGFSGAAHNQEAQVAAAARPSISIAFKNVCYFVPHPAPPPGSSAHELQLLHGITGAFRPGVLTALMVSRVVTGCARGVALRPVCVVCSSRGLTTTLDAPRLPDTSIHPSSAHAVALANRPTNQPTNQPGRLGGGQDNSDGRACRPQEQRARQRGHMRVSRRPGRAATRRFLQPPHWLREWPGSSGCGLYQSRARVLLSGLTPYPCTPPS
jgi:hypothetical protein